MGTLIIDPVKKAKADANTLMLTTPFIHQDEIWERTKDMEAFALFLEAGTGKTWIMQATAVHLALKDEIDLIVVLAPNGLHTVHADELEKHWPTEKIGYHLGIYQSGLSDKQLKALFDSLAPRKNSCAVLVMNIEALSSKRGVEWLVSLMKPRRRRILMTVDESHTVKNAQAKRTKSVLKMRLLPKYRRAMSGTPMGGGWEDLYAQFKFLNPDIIGLRTYTEFCVQYVVERLMQNYRAIVGYRNVDELLAKINPFSVSLTKDECLDLPGETFQTIHVPMSPEQATAYKSLVDQYVAELDGGQLIEATQITKRLVRLQQITSGFFVPDNGEPVKLACPKIDVMLEIVRTARHQVVIWCRFQADCRRVAGALEDAKITYGLYYGGATDEECTQAYQAFGRGELKVFIATPDKGGTGLNKLVGASTIIRYSHTNRFILYSQSMDRTKRIGQAHKNTYYDLVTPKTVEAKIIKTVTVDRADTTNTLRDATAWRAWLTEE
jgi:SNF2 family DNA or RNA helicase